MSKQHPTVIVEKIDNKAILPCKPKSFFDAGWDVYSLERVVIPAGGDALLSTGLRMAIPNGYCIQVNPRSGKATRDKLVIGARVIDAPYRGELKIHLINFGKEEVEISPDDPCAQLLILRTGGMIMEGVIEDLNTERGADGFGSSNSDLIKIAKEAREGGSPVKEEITMPMSKEAALSTLLVLHQRIERGDLKGTTNELRLFSKAIEAVTDGF